MKNLLKTSWLLLSLLLLLGALVTPGCGDAEDDCGSVGGVICNNCATGCHITCGDNEVESCVGLTYFGGDNPNDLRCAFCE